MSLVHLDDVTKTYTPGGVTVTALADATLTLDEGEFVCPASDEGGQRLTCAECRACAGNGAGRDASPCIVIHESPCVPYKVRLYRAFLARRPPEPSQRIPLLYGHRFVQTRFILGGGTPAHAP